MIGNGWVVKSAQPSVAPQWITDLIELGCTLNGVKRLSACINDNDNLKRLRGRNKRAVLGLLGGGRGLDRHFSAKELQKARQLLIKHNIKDAERVL